MECLFLHHFHAVLDDDTLVVGVHLLAREVVTLSGELLAVCGDGGDALQLYPNEIKGIDAVDWKEFPKALIVSDGKLLCGTIEERITEIDGLLDFVIS